MKVLDLHTWDVSAKEALAIQRDLAARVSREGPTEPVRVVAGVDVSTAGPARAAVVILSFPELQILEVRLAERPIDFPYIPGLLSFREAPVILDAFRQVETAPDLVFVDGQGIAHPRRLGIASHLGLCLDRPSIGCGKSVLRGKYEEPSNEPGSWSSMIDRGEVVGAALRTRRGVKPMYISIGNRISLENAVKYVMESCRGYRLPEPTRQAHRAAA